MRGRLEGLRMVKLGSEKSQTDASSQSNRSQVICWGGWGVGRGVGKRWESHFGDCDYRSGRWPTGRFDG